MQTFTQKIVQYIVDKELDLENLIIVLPSRRAIKYLSNALFETFQRPIFAPKTTTMNEWIYELSPFHRIDTTRALVKLYEVYQSKGNEVESFDEFLNWGTTLLNDFNEIDRYLLDAEMVFKNLADVKELENWNIDDWSFSEKELTETQKKIIEFWEEFPRLYNDFNAELTKVNCAIDGKCYRYVAENLHLVFNNPKTHILFAGFNALSASELSIVKQCHQMGRGHVLIDSDDFYLTNKQHEAGKFLRDLAEHLQVKELPFQQNKIRQNNVKIKIIGCAQKTGQAKVAATVLSDKSDYDWKDTLLLLADESLVESVVNHLPKTIETANITLGLPIKNTAIKTWCELLFSFQEHQEKFKTSAIYTPDLKLFSTHPFVLAILKPSERNELVTFEQKLILRNSVFFKKENAQLSKNIQHLLETIALPWKNWQEAINTIRELNQLVYSNLADSFSFEKAILEAFDNSLIDFQNIISEGIPPIKLSTFKKLFNQHWGGKSIAYHGNPLDGLQIMGILETRGLDFKRIICLGFNEGNLPPTNPIQTLIPMDLRYYFGLPGLREKQGLFAHHFYRLLHHCEEFTATYLASSQDIGNNEMSRYLMQLEMELSKENKNISIEHLVYTLNQNAENFKKTVEKTPEILTQMARVFERSTSASLLKKYIECPLDFYYQYVMDFGEEDTLEENIQANTFGTFIHNTLEKLYEPFAEFDQSGKKKSNPVRNITSIDLDNMLKEYSVLLNEEFLLYFNGDKSAFTKGKNLLSYQMANKMTKQFLESERDFLMQQTEPVFIEAVERKYEVDLTITIDGIKRKIKLKGTADRIDRIGEKVRIIDYKSGVVDQKSVSFGVRTSDFDTVLSNVKKEKHLLQLLMYAYFYQQENNVIASPQIISFVSKKAGGFPLVCPKNINLEQLLAGFPKIIEAILLEAFDTSVDFTHDFEKQFSYCKYCE